MWTPPSSDAAAADKSALTPASAEEMAACLLSAASGGKSISLFGNNSKRWMAGPVRRADVRISTRRMRRVLRYEPDDLTVSVEAGLPFRELQALLAPRRQMVALDPCFADESTVGGVVAANVSGSFCRRYGTVRDLVIGMSFAMLDGKVASSGGMVVKNVAGLDMTKIMIGSFGTLAAITSVNFRLHLIPENFRTVLFVRANVEEILERREQLLSGVLQPIAVDLLSPAAATRFNLRGYVLATRAGGSAAVLRRYENELRGCETLNGADDATFWQRMREFTPEFMRRQSGGVVLRLNMPLQDLSILLEAASGPTLSRAASGVTYVYLSTMQSVPFFTRLAAQHHWNCAVEFASDEARVSARDLWQLDTSEAQQNSFGMMKNIKRMFDEQGLLNQSRLYGRI